MPSDRVVVWGQEGCTNCDLVREKLEAKGIVTFKGDFDAIAVEPNLIRARAMAAYADQGYLPVIQVNQLVVDIEEAYGMLGI